MTKVIDGLSLGDWRAVCERAVGFGDKGQVLVVLGLECHLAPFSHLKPTLVVVVGMERTHAHTDKHTGTREGTHRTATIIRPRGSHTGAEHYTEKSRCGRRIFVIISQYGGGGGVGPHIYETRCWVWRAGQCDTTQSHCHSSTFSHFSTVVVVVVVIMQKQSCWCSKHRRIALNAIVVKVNQWLIIEHRIL